MSDATSQAAAPVAGIPRILHQIYFGGEDAAPESYRRYAGTWRVRHPGWDHQFWDAARCRALIEKHYPWFLPVYDGYRHRIQRVDAIRCFILYHHGGVYADMDIESLRPIDDLVAGRELLLGALSIGFTNAVMGSIPGHPLWERAFRMMEARRRRFAWSAPLWSKLTMPMQIGYSTGPRMLTDCVREAGYDRVDDPRVQICPTHVFEPLAVRPDPSVRDPKPDFSRSYAIHHMSMHWLPRRHKVMASILGVVAKAFGPRTRPAPQSADDEVPS